MQYYSRFLGRLIAFVCWCGIYLFLPSSVNADVLPHRSLQDVLTFVQKYKPNAIRGRKYLNFDTVVRELNNKRVVLVGEIHDRYEHHLNQLAILVALQRDQLPIGLGVEWFQQPFQGVLDAYLAGRISEATMLRQSGYYERWRYDYRMVRPIIEFARLHNIPIIALNAPAEITKKVAANGLSSLTAAERALLPAKITPPDRSYLARLKNVFIGHDGGKGKFENFALVQRIWEETMASNAAKFLQENPQHRLVILAGAGHVSYGTGIPKDLANYLPKEQITTILSSNQRDIQPELADYFLLNPQPYHLPPSGKLGVWLEQTVQGVMVEKLSPNGAAEKAGIQRYDYLLTINNIAIQRKADLLMELNRYQANERVNIKIQRRSHKATVEQRQLMVVLD